MRTSSRREFLRRAGALSLLRAAGPLGVQLLGIGAAAAASKPTDYRALICLFMYGANDGHNTVVALDRDAYARYASTRSTLVLPREQLLALPADPQGAFGLHPDLGPLKHLYQQGRAAILANVGPLLVPIKDAATFKSTNVARPPKLFSHNDQQAIWQAFSPEGAKMGWGGRIADLVAAQNGQPLFTAVSASGNAVFLASEQTLQYQIATNGAIGFNRITAGNRYPPRIAEALQTQISASQGDIFGTEYAATVRRSIEAQRLLASALSRLPASDPRVDLPPDLTQDRLAQQLRIVARLIGVRDDVNVQAHRQVFFVSLGGFDTHDNQLVRQAELLRSVAHSIAYFQNAMEELGVADKVTLFTASDFGRALLSNGDGSDHGWGNHHFIVGGAVRGGQLYGKFPETGLNTSTDVGNGRLLPTTAVDQYAATLARWMGVSESTMPEVLPNLGNFSTHDLGFMRTG